MQYATILSLSSFTMRITAWFPAFFGAVSARDGALRPENVASERHAELPATLGVAAVIHKES